MYQINEEELAKAKIERPDTWEVELIIVQGLIKLLNQQFEECIIHQIFHTEKVDKNFKGENIRGNYEQE